MKAADLAPLKRVLDAIGVSRATLWRALNSGIEHFPKPTIIRRRVYWALGEVPAIETALDAYMGRCAFDVRRRGERKRVEGRHEALAQARAAKRRSRRRSRKKPGAPDEVQKDLFDA